MRSACGGLCAPHTAEPTTLSQWAVADSVQALRTSCKYGLQSLLWSPNCDSSVKKHVTRVGCKKARNARSLSEMEKIPDIHLSLPHLPERRQRELERITRSILYHARPVDIEFILLFGSHARGDWVQDYDTGYDSDYDILVITKSERKNNLAFEHRLNSEVRGELGASFPSTIKIIAHGLRFVNQRIRKQYYFWVDVVVKEGIILYDSGRGQLAQPEPLLPDERRAKAQEAFEQWFKSATSFLRRFDFEMSLADRDLLGAAFELHQTTERLYHCFTLVFTDYKPKEHDLEVLGARAALLAPEMWSVFPRQTEEEKRLFELLRRAYVDARYKMDRFVITAEELAQIATWVRALRDLTETLCTAEIQRLGL